ncbi:STAS domain-containing protein [Paraglaciecola aquimarina]|uniref:STAS domain-containing protein n=1 Tax=Paraglaciecola aquimarina TaxID=1235557 RepID=A0ABU3SS49_9ALTE|nr:STAS domain-containing protein [Paraglaciecola aquimarina]MDU0352821.1 STAS domain-containing protein [Paraglaciecola aquimarina]
MKELMVVAQSEGHFLLQGDLNRDTVPNSRQPLQELIKFHQSTPSKSATLDMSGIVHADTTGLAWLLNLLKDCQQRNIELEIVGTPETLVNLAKISDVDALLSLQ